MYDKQGVMIAQGFVSDAEACRWHLDVGQKGDRLGWPGEDMAKVVKDVLDITVEYDAEGAAITPAD